MAGEKRETLLTKNGKKKYEIKAMKKRLQNYYH